MADDPVLVITGASSGIGAATARRAAEFGYRVVLAARSEDKLEQLAERAGRRRARDRGALRRDELGGPAGARGQAALDRFGRMDAFFANAGFGAKRGFLEETPEHWKAMVDTNVYGAALSIRAALGHFREQDARPHAAHELGRGPPRAARLALLGHQVGRHGDGRGAARRRSPTATSRSR